MFVEERARAELVGELLRQRQLVLDHATDLVGELRRSADRIERQVEATREEIRATPGFPAYGPADKLVSAIHEESTTLDLWRRNATLCTEAGAVRALRAIGRTLSVP